MRPVCGDALVEGGGLLAWFGGRDKGECFFECANGFCDLLGEDSVGAISLVDAVAGENLHLRQSLSTLRAKADLPFGIVIGFGQSKDLFAATICDDF